jgi:hypothetical protein
MTNTTHLFRGRKVWASATQPQPLPIRTPTFQVSNGAAGWIATNYPTDQRERKAFLVLFFLGGFIDAGHSNISIREIAAATELEAKRVLQILVKLEKERWLTIDWAQDRFEPNHYQLNVQRRLPASHDPYRHTYQPKKKDSNGNNTPGTN